MKKWFGVISINIIIIALLLIVAEGILRWHYFGLPMDRQHLPHPYLQNVIRPGIEIRPGEFLDQEGFRMTGAFQGGEDVYKVLAIGDSCTFSVGASNSDKTYPALLEKKYHDQFGRMVEVYNAGVPGHNSMQMFLRLHYLLKDIQPDEVIIYGGWNDFRVLLHDRGELYIENNALGMPKIYRHGTYWELQQRQSRPLAVLLSRSFLFNHLIFKIKAHYLKKTISALWKDNGIEYMPKKSLKIPVILDHFKNNIESIICLAKGKGAKVSIITLATPLKKRYNAHEKTRFLKAFGGDPGNFGRLTPAEQYYYVERSNNILKMLAAKHKANLYDWDRWFDAIYDVSFFVDIAHPSDKGYEYMVDRIVETLKQ